MPKWPLRRNVHNPHASATYSHNIVEDLAQDLCSIFALEVLQNYYSQCKALLDAIGGVNHSYSKLITFILDQVEPYFSHYVDFQIKVYRHKKTIHRCIVDEGD